MNSMHQKRLKRTQLRMLTMPLRAVHRNKRDARRKGEEENELQRDELHLLLDKVTDKMVFVLAF